LSVRSIAFINIIAFDKNFMNFLHQISFDIRLWILKPGHFSILQFLPTRVRVRHDMSEPLKFVSRFTPTFVFRLLKLSDIAPEIALPVKYFFPNPP